MEQWKELLEYGKKCGVQLPNNVEFVYSEEKGISCIATELIQDARLYLPKELIICKELSNRHFKPLVLSELHHNTWLKLFVSKLKFSEEPVEVEGIDVKDKFLPYINNLPKEVNSPLTWNPSELELLHGTNLLNSWKDKLQSIYEEWWEVIKNTPFKAVEYDIRNFSLKEIYTVITSKVYPGQGLDYWSFPAFLWAHLIFTSRAFPQRVVDPSCEEWNVILLPILDLLNHANRSKIEWSCSPEGGFVFTMLEPVNKGAELCNNYGAKGNEELLQGYGFVIDGNEFDNAALKIKLSKTTIEQLIKDNVYLPTLDDYTTFAFDLNESNNRKSLSDLNHYEDGIMYFINKDLDSMKHLLDLFAHLSKNVTENPRSLRCQLMSIQSLKNALKHKLSLLTETTKPLSDYKYPINEHRSNCATIYKTGQIAILQTSINNLRRLEKHLVKEYKGYLGSISNILKHDYSFESDYLSLYDDDAHATPLVSDYETAIAWLLVRSQIKTSPTKYDWVLDRFLAYMSSNKPPTSSDMGERLFEHFFPNGNQKYTQEFLESIVHYVDTFAYLKQSNSNSTEEADLTPIFTKEIEIAYL